MEVIDTSRVRRICISRLKFIGDIVLTTPVIGALRERYPEATLAYLGEKQAVSLLEQNPALDEIIPFDFSKPTIFEQPRVIAALRRSKFDVFIDLFSNPRSAILARASGAPVRIGKDVQGRGRLYTHRIAGGAKPESAVATHYRYVKPLGVEPTGRNPEIFLTGEEKREARTYLKWQDIDLSKPVVGLHPGATWPAKRWEWEKFADLADLIRAKLGAQVVITQGPNDAALAGRVARKATGSLLVLPVTGLRQLAAIIAQFTVYVANDNGTMHIAAAVGTGTIGIFGPGEEDIWFPYGDAGLPAAIAGSAAGREEEAEDLNPSPAAGAHPAAGPPSPGGTSPGELLSPVLPPQALRRRRPGEDEQRVPAHAALRKDVSCHPCHLDFCDREGEGYMECMKLLGVKEVFEEVRKRMP